jgi:hypothetical protein
MPPRHFLRALPPPMFRRPDDLREEDFPIKHRAIGSFAEVEPLLVLCAQGKLYEVEGWLAQGRPVQFPPPEDRKLQRRQTALQIAVGKGFHSLAAVLLANGYNPNADYYECLSPAVRAKDQEMVELLLRFGADPHAVDFCDVLETCDRPLMDRFIAAGADPCRENALARALHFKGRPILGFIKQYKEQFPCIQRQIDIALHVFTEAEDLRGIALMLWVGADPHAPTPSSAYKEDESYCSGTTAFDTALYSRKPEVMAMIAKRPIPDARVAEVFQSVAYQHRPDLVRRLLKQGADPNCVSEEGYHVLHAFLYPLLSRFDRDKQKAEQAFEALEMVLQAGAKWTMDERQLKGLRRDLADGESKTVVRLMDLLHKHGALSPDQLHELTRTPAVRRVLNGFSKPPRHTWGLTYTPAPPPVAPPAPTRGYWKRHWSQR